MTEVKEVTAWAVVDKDRIFDPDDVYRLLERAHQMAAFWDGAAPNTAPHRVIKVRIVPVEDEK